MLDEVREQVDRAAEHLGRGHVADAAAAFEDAVRLAPGEITLRQRLADVYLRLGHRAHALAEYQHIAGRYAAEGELFKAIAVCKLIGAIEPGRRQTLQAITELYALQRGGSATAMLPANMSGAVAAQEPAPDLDLESLDVLRNGLPPASDQEAAALPLEGAVEIDLGPLPQSPLFSALDKDGFAALVDAVELRWMRSGATIVAEGARGESMFVVVQGAVDVRRGEKAVAVIGEGSFFGEMALVTDSPRLATVAAARDGLLFELHRSKLAEIVARHPAVGKVIDDFYRDRLLANVIRASPVFRPFSEHETASISQRFVRHSLPPSNVVLRQDEPGRGFFVILRGRCDVVHETAQGEVPVRQMREGDVFGEISLLLDGPCTATVRTASACEVLELQRDDFRALVLPNRQVREMIEKIANERLARTADLLERQPRVLRDYNV
ncbi:MAG: cyclic nucleotide-binding domain-containing protein [Myxococcales bacterium]